MIINYLLLLVTCGLALWAIERRQIYLLGVTGTAIAVYFLLLGATALAITQLIVTWGIVAIYRYYLVSKKPTVTGSPNWLRVCFIVLLLVFVLSTLSSLAALLPPSGKNLDFYTGAMLLVCGLYGVGLKKDMLQILISLVISEFSIELMLTTLGEGTSVTLFLVLAANWLMAAIAARLDDLDVNKLQELRG